MAKIKVLIVDDSALVRQTLSEILSADPTIEVLGVAADPLIALQKIAQNPPDVITLDLEMPRMDGLTFLRHVMSRTPIPVVVCSALAEKGAETTFRAMEYGAVDIIQKPKAGTKKFLEDSRIILCDAVKAAAKAHLRPLPEGRSGPPAPRLTADAVLPPGGFRPLAETTDKVVVLGASTGGTEAIRFVLQELPSDAPGLVIVQHMPEHFTRAFAERLDSLCRVSVKEAADGDTVIRGRALIAPGNRHTLLRRSGARYYVEVQEGALVNRHRPSVDVLFRSAAQAAGKNLVGVIMTGMGDDGAKGMLEMKKAGAVNFAQDEATCVVFGMPKEAIKLGGVDRVVPLEAIPAAVLKAVT